MARVTIKTLAESVGVSPSTISNAYNKPGQLSADLRERILAKADELGFAGPDSAGRALRSGHTGSIGVLFTERLSYAFSDPYAVGFLKGLSQVAEGHGTSILLLPTTKGTDPDTTAVRAANVDALTTFCVSFHHPAAILAKTRNIPLVYTDRHDDPEASWVAIDEERGGALLGEHLAALGHRRVTVLVDSNEPAGSRPQLADAANLGSVDSSVRLQGLMTAMPDAEITLISGGHNAEASGHSAAGLALDAQDRPTALVGFSDVIALGAIRAVRQRGLTPGRDISVCGFDDIPAAEAAGLTTVRQPIVDKGCRVGELLLDPTLSERQVSLPIELVVRATTGPAPRHS